MKWKGTSTGVEPPRQETSSYARAQATQSARPGNSLPPLADAESTAPDGPIIKCATTRALVAPLALPASTSRKQLRETPPLERFTTLVISAWVSSPCDEESAQPWAWRTGRMGRWR